MLRTEPAGRSRDVTDAPLRPEPQPAPPPEAPDDQPRSFLDTVLDDAEVLEPEPPGPTTSVRCLSCRADQEVALQATGYRCTTCTRVWRWAVCGSCDELSVTLARQESWRCRSCGASTRSWWRTPDAPRQAIEVANRRRLDAAKHRRTQAQAALRRQRARLIAGAGAVGLIVAAVLVVGRLNATGDDVAVNTSAATCAAFHDLEADIARNAVPPAAIRTRLDELARNAADAEDAVRIGAERLASSGRPGDATFEEVKAQLAGLCRRTG
jgi:hypothetical protein